MPDPGRLFTLTTLLKARLVEAQRFLDQAEIIVDEVRAASRNAIAGSLNQENDMAAPKGKRPITRALNLVKATKYDADRDAFILSTDARAELIDILDPGVDASTGTADAARRRRHRAAKKSAKRPAKKARARR